jgi:hypothetical protein
MVVGRHLVSSGSVPMDRRMVAHVASMGPRGPNA